MANMVGVTGVLVIAAETAADMSEGVRTAASSSSGAIQAADRRKAGRKPSLSR